MKDYYYILGIKRNATPIEIRAAYRKLSKKFHPDLNSGDKFFEERFKEIQEAYEILIDSLKREKYDESFEKEKIYPNYNYSKSESRSTYESKYKSYKTNSSNGNDKVKSSNNLYILISIVSVFVLSIYIISFNTDSQKEAKSSSETSIQKQELNNSNIQSHLNDKTSKTFEKNNEEKLILSPYQRKLKPKDLFGYCLKIYGYDYNTKDFLVNYLETFDRDYNNYKRNEFILESKINEALSEISNLLDSIEYTIFSLRI
jgi:curved DNA-binding protein CbpA